jgi:16S rRNA (uracil1498-N3)-methyltransferase
VKHVPHVVVAAPWEGEEISLTVVQWKHLTKVLRLRRGDQVSYTDGLGTSGTGRLGSQVLERGDEWQVERPSTLTMAVAPPASKDRQRYLVEKLAELGVARLVWLDSKHGKSRVANPAKVFSWVLSATEQSRGAWLMETSDELVGISAIEGSIAICQPGGDADPPHVDVVLIGPEGGFDDGEIPAGAHIWDLGPTILRVETAAVVAASRIVAQ